jgi:probable rRNA maturation factor
MSAKLSGFSEQWVKNWARKTALALRRSDDDITVAFTGEAKIRALNKKYRSIDKATDVLSFPADREGDMGDIFIAPAFARAKAAERGSSYKDYLALLIVHSVLHLAGYDHHTEKESASMARMEKKVLKQASGAR